MCFYNSSNNRNIRDRKIKGYVTLKNKIEEYLKPDLLLVGTEVYPEFRYGRFLFNLIADGRINEDVLNCTQKSYINMYKNIFSFL